MSNVAEYILMEKVSKKEIDDALSNPNVRVGAEFEYFVDQDSLCMDAYVSEQENPWTDWMEYAEKHNKMMKEYVEQIAEYHEKFEKWQTIRETQGELFDGDEWPEPDEPMEPNTKMPYLLDRELWSQKDEDFYNEHSVQIFDMSKLKEKKEEWQPDPPSDSDYRDECFKLFKSNGLPRDWEYKEDGSLSAYPVDCEIATTPMPLNEFLVMVPKTFDLIDEYGIVNDECGFHIGISLSNVPDLEKTLDVVKLALFTDEDYIFKFFSGRQDNTYVSLAHDKILSSYIVTPDSFKTLIDTGKLGREYGKEHYNAINHQHLSENNKYIEFRYLGGKNYHQKWDKIKVILGQYINNMVLACDPEYKKKEYILKIQRILNKIDFQAKKQLELEMNRALKTANPEQQKFLKSKLNKLNKVIAMLDAKPDMRLDSAADYMASEWYTNDIFPTMEKLKKAGDKRVDKKADDKNIVAKYFALEQFLNNWRSKRASMDRAARMYYDIQKEEFQEMDSVIDEFVEEGTNANNLETQDEKKMMDLLKVFNDKMAKLLHAAATASYDNRSNIGHTDRRRPWAMIDSIEPEDEPMLVEKVSKRDVDAALRNKHVNIGAEFEFIVPTFNAKYGRAAELWTQWDRYNQQYDAWESSAEEYTGAGNEEGYDPPSLPDWAHELGYEDGEDELPNPTELFEMPEMDIEKFFHVVVDEFLPLDKLPFDNMIIDHDNTTKSATQWVIKPDATLGPAGIEIVSPILTIEEYLDLCPKMFDFVEKYGATDDSCGFHISISLKNVPELSKTLDVVKMALFLEEDYIYHFFKKRRDNDYARSAHKAVKTNLTGKDVEEFIKDNIDVTKLKKAIPDTHYEAINIEHLTDTPAKQYIEFRYLGSGDYHKKWKEIRTITAHYIWALSVGNDPEYMKKEYLLKMNRLMLKYQMFTLKKELVIMVGNKTDDSPKYEAIEKEIKKLTSMGVKVTPEEMKHFDPEYKEKPVEVKEN